VVVARQLARLGQLQRQPGRGRHVGQRVVGQRLPGGGELSAGPAEGLGEIPVCRGQARGEGGDVGGQPPRDLR
jgi:hypothetical protein